MEKFVAYIDEAGDEGFGKLKSDGQSGGQSQWLIMGAMVVREKNDVLIPKWKKDICAKFPEMQSPDLHWNRLNHERRVVVVSDLSVLPVRGLLAVSHKVTIPNSRYNHMFKRPGYLYNYLTRWLIERIISFCELQAGQSEASLRIVFSKKKSTNYESMKEYLRLLSRGGDVVKAPRETNWGVLDIDGIQVENHSKRAGLQLADCITSAFFTALERNRYGNIETAYARRLIRVLGSDQYGLRNNIGLTVVPGMHAASPDDEQIAFLRECWGGRAPGP